MKIKSDLCSRFKHHRAVSKHLSNKSSLHIVHEKGDGEDKINKFSAQKYQIYSIQVRGYHLHCLLPKYHKKFSFILNTFTSNHKESDILWNYSWMKLLCIKKLFFIITFIPSSVTFYVSSSSNTFLKCHFFRAF